MRGVRVTSILIFIQKPDDLRCRAMPIDRKLLEILRCPVTKQQVFPLTAEKLAKINQAITGGNIRYVDDKQVDAPLTEGLVTENGQRIYRIDENIPIMLEDESILTNQIEGF